MYNKISVSRLLLASTMMLACTIPALAQTAVVTPAMTISDGTNSVTINGSNVQTVNSGSATLVSFIGTGVVTGGSGPSMYPVGAIVVNGKIGNFTLVNLVGQGRLSFSQPSIDLGVSTLTTLASGGGTLTVTFTDKDYMGTSPATITPITDYTAGGGGSNTTSYYLYVDATDAPFGGSPSGPTGDKNATPAAELLNTGNERGVSVAATTTMASTFSMTVVEAITIGANGYFGNDFGALTTSGGTVTPPSPMITLSKCVAASGSTTTCATGPTTVAPFTKVTYLYTVKNTSTNTTLPVTGIKIVDDNATPDYTADDFTVCTIASLAPGASQTCSATVYPPISEGANDCSNQPFNYGNYHAGGTLICQLLSNGDINFHWVLDEGTIDNTYGNGASGDWPSGSSFSWLPNNAAAEFQIYDAKGNKCLDFINEYLSSNSSYLSGWGSGGTVYVASGNGGNITKCDTSLSQCLNRNKATAQCVSDSPTNNPDWNKKCAYIVHVSCNAWGSNGFGNIQCPWTANSYTKNSQCTFHECKPVNSTATNTAVATGVFGGNTITSNKATATVTIDCNPKVQCPVPLPITCNTWAQAPQNCKPKNGGHDGDGYAYCDALLPNSLTCNGVQFQLGSGTERCATKGGGTIPVPNVQCSSLKFLAAGINGNQYNQCFTVNYTDGSSKNFFQNLSDWCGPQNFAGETIASQMPYRITPNGSQQYGTICLYQYSIPCDNTKTVKSITCPNNNNVVLHAITLCP